MIHSCHSATAAAIRLGSSRQGMIILRRTLPSAATQSSQHFTTTSATNSNSSKIPFYGAPAPPPNTSSSTSSTVQQRLILALKSASTAFRDPTRDDAVAALGEITGTVAVHRMVQQMKGHPTGRSILQEQPIISKATIPYERFLEEAKDLPSMAECKDDQDATITFGQAYGRFLLEHGFDPDERKPIQHMDNNSNNNNDKDSASSHSSMSDAAYVMLRYRQCHDYWHALTGLPPTVLGELALKWLELFQTGLPIAALSGTVGSLGLSAHEQQLLWTVYLPWAIRVHRQQQQQTGQDGGSLLTVYYEHEFDTPLIELRQRIGIEAAPQIVGDER